MFLCSIFVYNNSFIVHVFAYFNDFSVFLAELVRKFGLTPEQFGENLRDNYQRHDVEQDPAEPEELAREFIKGYYIGSEIGMIK